MAIACTGVGHPSSFSVPTLLRHAAQSSLSFQLYVLRAASLRLRPPAAGWEAVATAPGDSPRLGLLRPRVRPGCDPAPVARHPPCNPLGPILRHPQALAWPALAADRAHPGSPRHAHASRPLARVRARVRARARAAWARPASGPCPGTSRRADPPWCRGTGCGWPRRGCRAASP